MRHASPSVVRDHPKLDEVLTIIIGAFLIASCSSLRTRSIDGVLKGLEQRGEDEYSVGSFERARDDWQHGLEVARQHGRTDMEASFLIDLARIDEESGQYREALAHGTEAAEIARSIPSAGLEAQALIQLGQAQRALSEYGEAKQNLDTALRVALQLDDQRLACHSLRGLGAVAQSEGRPDDAVNYYADSLRAARAARDRPCEAQTLNNIGGFYRSAAEYERAIQYYEGSLVLRRRLGDRRGEAKVLGNLCLVYMQLNDHDKAKRGCEASLRIAIGLGARATEANNLNNLGALYRNLGDLPTALSYYERALKIKSEIRDRDGEARTLNNLGETSWQLGRYDEATDYLQRSLEIDAAIGDVSGEAASHQTLGSIAGDRGDYETANEHLQQALLLAVETHAPEVRWRALDKLGVVAAAQGNRPLAIFFSKQAVNTIQSVRGNIAKLERGLQRSFLADKVRVYKRLADLLIEEGRLWEAEQVLAMLKEEEYLHFVRGAPAGAGPTTDAPLTRAESDERDRYEEIVNNLVASRSAYAALDRKKQRSALTPEEQQRLDVLTNELTIVRKEFNRYLQEVRKDFQTLNDAGRSIEFGARQLESLTSLQGTLHDLSERLGRNAVLVHYLIMPDRLRMIVTGPDLSIAPIHRDSPIGEGELNRRVAAFRAALRDPRGVTLPASKALYEVLIAPILTVLEALKAEILMVYLDGVLRYVPIAALREGDRYLAEDYAVAVYTSAAASNLRETAPKNSRVAALGVSQAYGDFPALPAVVEELDDVVKTGANDSKGIVPGAEYLNDAFTPERLEEVLKEECAAEKCYRLVHLATHFNFLPGTDQGSFLLTGGGVRLSLADLVEGDYQLAGLDLLTLSACETALGSDNATGSEVEGLGTLAQNKGAHAVLATLWKVSDPSTAAFMEQFYRNRQQGGDAKVEALRQAQVSFIRGTVGGSSPGAAVAGRGEPLVAGADGHAPEGWAHPYYWAPFILMGNFL